jgi:pimeloyl-ACP methyl ester carboxylesterase
VDECAEAAADVLATLGTDKPVDWVGNWGGHVGVVFAARWPERRGTLVTLGTPIQSYTLSERLQIWILLPVVRLLGRSAPLSRAYETCCSPPQPAHKTRRRPGSSSIACAA